MFVRWLESKFDKMIFVLRKGVKFTIFFCFLFPLKSYPKYFWKQKKTNHRTNVSAILPVALWLFSNGVDQTRS